MQRWAFTTSHQPVAHRPVMAHRPELVAYGSKREAFDRMLACCGRLDLVPPIVPDDLQPAGHYDAATNTVVSEDAVTMVDGRITS